MQGDGMADGGDHEKEGDSLPLAGQLDAGPEPELDFDASPKSSLSRMIANDWQRLSLTLIVMAVIGAYIYFLSYGVYVFYIMGAEDYVAILIISVLSLIAQMLIASLFFLFQIFSALLPSFILMALYIAAVLLLQKAGFGRKPASRPVALIWNLLTGTLHIIIWAIFILTVTAGLMLSGTKGALLAAAQSKPFSFNIPVFGVNLGDPFLVHAIVAKTQHGWIGGSVYQLGKYISILNSYCFDFLLNFCDWIHQYFGINLLNLFSGSFISAIMAMAPAYVFLPILLSRRKFWHQFLLYGVFPAFTLYCSYNYFNVLRPDKLYLVKNQDEKVMYGGAQFSLLWSGSKAIVLKPVNTTGGHTVIINNPENIQLIDTGGRDQAFNSQLKAYFDENRYRRERYDDYFARPYDPALYAAYATTATAKKR